MHRFFPSLIILIAFCQIDRVNAISFNDRKFFLLNQFLDSYENNGDEEIHLRAKRAIGNDTTIFPDGSGATTEIIVSSTPLSVASTTTTSTLGTNSSLTTTAVTTSVTPTVCNGSTQVQLTNGTCLSITAALTMTINTIRSNSSDYSALASALSFYFSLISTLNGTINSSLVLSANEIDNLISLFTNVSLFFNTNSSLIMALPPYQVRTNTTVYGAIYQQSQFGQAIDNTNINNVLNSNISVAAFFSQSSLINAVSINMLIVDDPVIYVNIDQSNTVQVVSSVVVVTLKTTSSFSTPTNVSLFFQILDEYRSTTNGSYSCVYYDMNTQRWNNSACFTAIYNVTFNRYECICTHLSTFALVRSLPSICNTTSQVALSNGTCVTKEEGQITAVTILRSNSTNATDVANALSLYISAITNANISSNISNPLTIGEIDGYLSNISNTSVTINNTNSILIATPVNQGNNVIIQGASFTNGSGGTIIYNTNRPIVLNSAFSAAAVISNASLAGVTALNMLIISDPTQFKNSDNYTNKTLVSSIIMASVQSNNVATTPMNISLYFQSLDGSNNNYSRQYLCSYYDTTRLRWNESGCTLPQYNAPYRRYECSCNHLTSFALLWLPQSLSSNTTTRSLDAQDIASLVFQSLSILCFLIIMIHAVVIRFLDPTISSRAYDLLPLISTAATTILFIFYIALGMTVYTRAVDSNQTQCFQSASVLMFFVYFFLIFMLCVKTSVGYFNYLRFVLLFPEPSARKLFIMLVISFFISITWVSFAAGFNSNPSFNITQMYSLKLCWFTRNVIYYFVTIPVAIFLFFTIVSFILVTRRIINHVRQATTPDVHYERMKRCVLVLLSSCVTQGIGWLFGPFISIVNPSAGNVLGWFFIVLNGLEGVWSIILYFIIRSKRMYEPKRIQALRDLTDIKEFEPIKNKKSLLNTRSDADNNNQSRFEERGIPMQPRDSRLFHDLQAIDSIEWPRDEKLIATTSF